MNDKFVPIEDLAEHFTVTVQTIRTWVRQGLIPTHTYLKVGNTYRFSIPRVVDALVGTPPEAPNLPEPDKDDGKIPVQLELDFSNPDVDA